MYSITPDCGLSAMPKFDGLPKIQITFPLKGLSENYSFAEGQEPGTTRDALNIRAIDPKTGRTRGAQRSGLNRFLDDVHSGAAEIQEIASVPQAQALLTYTTDTTPEKVFSKTLANEGAVSDMKQDEFTNLYVLQGDRACFKYNYDGGLITTIEVPDEGKQTNLLPKLACVEPDKFQNVFIGSGVFSSLTDQSLARLYAFQFQIDGTYKLAWSLDSGRHFDDVVVHETADGSFDLLCCENDVTNNKTYFTVYRDVGFLTAPTEDTAARVTLDSLSDQNILARRMVKREDGVCYISGAQNHVTSTNVETGTHTPAGSSATVLTDSTATFQAKGVKVGDTVRNTTDGSNGIITSVDSETQVTVEELLGGTDNDFDQNDVFAVDKLIQTRVWKVNAYADNASTIVATLKNTTGIGWGVAIGPKNTAGDPSIYCCGNEGAATGTVVNVRRVIDTGQALNAAGTDNWTANPSGEFKGEGTNSFHNRLRLATDHDDRLYLPYVNTENDVLIYDTDGTERNSFSHADIDSAGIAIVVPQTKPDYGSVTIEEVEFLFLGTFGSSVDLWAFWKFRIAPVDTQATSALRTFKNIAMGGGNIETFTQGGSFADPANGTGVAALAADAPYVQSVVAIARYDSDDEIKGRLRVYITDGENYQKYDPEDDAVSNWESVVSGIIPPRCRLIELWQGRIVLAKDPENPTAWHMSAINNPEDFDIAPQVISPAIAVSGFNSPIGGAPDIVNALIPWDDDLLIFGCDHSIWALRGNPLLGGQYDKITTQHGMAFGRPYAFDASGQTLYYMDTQGGVHSLRRGSEPVRITRDRVERRIADAINWTTHYIRLEWNRRDEGLHIFQIPFSGASGAIVKAWFWDRKNDFWGEDQFGTSSDTAKQPTSVFTIDGDKADDRVMLLGCEDGRIRGWDLDSVSDDNTTSTDIGTGHGGSDLAIDSFVVIGPIEPRKAEIETQFQDFTTWFAYDQDGVNYDWFLDDEPDDALNHAPRWSGSLNPGRSPTKLQKFTADVAYLRFRNGNATQRWAFERAQIGYVAAGEKRKWD